MKLEDAFDTFYERIAIGAVPEGRIESAWERLRDYLTRQCDVPHEGVFLQGSYANDTTIQPTSDDGEYDLDVAAVIIDDETMTADSAFAYLEGVLKEDGDYKKRLETGKQPCVRLRYADDETGKFHIDIVAAQYHPEGHLLIPLRGNGWKETNPKGYTRWCEAQGERFRRTVRILKRWRDENQDERRGVKSIVLQVLIAHALPITTDDAESVAGTLSGIRDYLELHVTPPDVYNPTLQAENLTKTWPQEHYNSFRSHINSAADLAQQALDCGDRDESHQLWGDLLGSDFPSPPNDPAERTRKAPETPPPGYSTSRQNAPRRERYGHSRE